MAAVVSVRSHRPRTDSPPKLQARTTQVLRNCTASPDFAPLNLSCFLAAARLSPLLTATLYIQTTNATRSTSVYDIKIGTYILAQAVYWSNYSMCLSPVRYIDHLGYVLPTRYFEHDSKFAQHKSSFIVRNIHGSEESSPQTYYVLCTWGPFSIRLRRAAAEQYWRLAPRRVPSGLFPLGVRWRNLCGAGSDGGGGKGGGEQEEI